MSRMMGEVMDPLLELVYDLADGDRELMVKALVLSAAQLMAEEGMGGVELGVADQKITLLIEDE
ncbi:hypothetical protein CHUUTOTORO_02290 [Serratia phage vB_SmaM-ChuuTotoro]|nr:hypothetical protein CHUUTOTORO_02290 [Serratia phage vB_SmaM-ChuuTotoro]